MLKLGPKAAALTETKLSDLIDDVFGQEAPSVLVKHYLLVLKGDSLISCSYAHMPKSPSVTPKLLMRNATRTIYCR